MAIYYVALLLLNVLIERLNCAFPPVALIISHTGPLDWTLLIYMVAFISQLRLYGVSITDF